MCIRNWLRRLFRRKQAEKRKFLSDWAAGRIDDMIMAEARITTNILFAGEKPLTITIRDILTAKDLDKGT